MTKLLRIRYGLCKLISYFPFNFLRVNLYRILMRYKIGKHVKLGYGSYIHASNVTIGDNVRLKQHNKLYRLNTLIIGESTVIGGFNNFHGASFSTKHHLRNHVELGRNCHITSDNVYDAACGIIFRDGVKIGGRGTDFWSHGSTKENDTIIVDEGTRFGLSCKIGTAVKIGKNCLIGMGSVVTKSFPEDNCLIAGVPAKVIRRDYNWHDHWW